MGFDMPTNGSLVKQLLVAWVSIELHGRYDALDTTKLCVGTGGR